MCPEGNKDTDRKKRNGKQPKGWNFPPCGQDKEEEEVEEETIQIGNNQTTKVPENQEEVPQDLNGKHDKQEKTTNNPEDMDTSGYKRTHSTDNLDSEKDNARPKLGF